MKKLSAIIVAAFVFMIGLYAQKIDFSDIRGPVKPVNGVGQPPLQGYVGTKFFKYLKQAGIPYSRLHDVGGAYGKNIFVDIPNLFRDFDADENKPENYDFAFTDNLLKALVDNGVEPYFRLGVTIENAPQVKAYRIYPPKDYAKWARICEHVIMHYNEGWANGLHLGISHWEIWNEPENFEDPMENNMWRGTFEQYMDLYAVAAPYLKKKFPQLMIGGYASCGFYAITDQTVAAANSSSRSEYFIKCFIAFLEKAKKESWPLDFFSCHSYASVDQTMVHMDYARKTLDSYGFVKTQLSVNEWLPSPDIKKLNTSQQAAEVMAEIIGFQNGPVDDAEIYDARVSGGTYAPLFTPETGKPRKAYYSFLAFNELRKLGYSIRAPQMPDGVYLTAATDCKDKAAVLVSNISGSDWKNDLELGEYRLDVALVIDEDNNLAMSADSSVLPNNSVLLLLLSK